jgi:hypothetical protein
VLSLTWRLLLVATATNRAGFGLQAGTLSQFTAPAMRKEMHWSLTAGALLALVLHHPPLLQPVVAEASPAALELFQGASLPELRFSDLHPPELVLPGVSQAVEGSD